MPRTECTQLDPTRESARQGRHLLSCDAAGLLHGLAITLLTAATLFTQIPVHPHVVLTRLPSGNPSPAQVEVDPSLATAVQLRRFPHGNLTPLLIASDPSSR